MMEPHADILLAEDDDDLRDAMLDTLQDAGYRVVAVPNGQEAMIWLHETEHLPSLILLDLMMPVMDGWQFREAQLEDPRTSKVPVVILSAMGAHPSIDAAEFLRKPMKAQPLIEVVRRFCGTRVAG